jgi:hypothetical protein
MRSRLRSKEGFGQTACLASLVLGEGGERCIVGVWVVRTTVASRNKVRRSVVKLM